MKHKINRTGLFILTFLLGSIVAFAQGTPDVSGTYEGMVKRPGGTTEDKVSLELKSEGGKITGRAIHGPKSVDATEAKFENGTLTLTFDKDHKFTGKFDGDKLVGEFTDGAQKIPLELKRPRLLPLLLLRLLPLLLLHLLRLVQSISTVSGMRLRMRTDSRSRFCSL